MSLLVLRVVDGHILPDTLTREGESVPLAGLVNMERMELMTKDVALLEQPGAYVMVFDPHPERRLPGMRELERLLAEAGVCWPPREDGGTDD